MHIGQNITRIRSFQGIKQTDMARRLKISQQAYSKIEQSPEIEDEFLDKIAAELSCTPEVLKQLGESPFMQNFNQNCGNVIGYQFNPIEKIVELYEALLKSEKEKNVLLERLLGKEKGK